ncbi:hypothetical protein VK792_11430 [Mesobacterium sp. TK19101]|uniref:Uncharacterized protein n=1 Tax=Mesobacterium hydrothermale TaxID=3111907 RepID=A0ABU6HHT2_9RHOB|nr:hypothetical protein [Mesobacterium sp. TK19101]MEC3861896.1 hypothetical protein [Mesobacterium sp. TK19101]
MKFLSCIALCIFGANAASAGQFCEIDGSEMFACTFKGGAKAVELCDAFWLDGNMASYGFFNRNGVVEKGIVIDKAALIARPWSGMGRYISESITFPVAGGYAYEVFWSVDRNTNAEIEGGILVLKDGNEIATLTCDPGSVTQNMTALIDMIDIAQTSR